MLPANASAPSSAEQPALGLRGGDLLAAYLDHLATTGRGSDPYRRAATRFLTTWPDPQDWARLPLADRLAADANTRPVITYLMLHEGLRPGYDYLLSRKLSPIWRELQASPLQGQVEMFLDAAASLGFTERTRLATGSQVPVRLLIQTSRAMGAWAVDDLAQLRQACQEREQRTGRSHRHYLSAITLCVNLC